MQSDTGEQMSFFGNFFRAEDCDTGISRTAAGVAQQQQQAQQGIAQASQQMQQQLNGIMNPSAMLGQSITTISTGTLSGSSGSFTFYPGQVINTTPTPNWFMPTPNSAVPSVPVQTPYVQPLPELTEREKKIIARFKHLENAWLKMKMQSGECNFQDRATEVLTLALLEISEELKAEKELPDAINALMAEVYAA